ncbi:cellulase family glycosylhydrolase [Chitinophaga sp.]|uniref:glycoside hydrolase 5 family protein n=1 Tax=Chitinophaga sp. TaxID=1869181 RepID=UPI0031CE5F1E
MPRFTMKAPVLLAIILLTLCTDTTIAQNGFITRSGHQFSLHNKPYYYIGTNYWYGGLLALQKNGKERLKRELDFLESQGVNNLRVLVGTEGKGLVNGVERVKPAFQYEQGKFNMEILDGLDYLLYEMGKRKMYAVLFLSNNWEWSGGFLQYLNWNRVISDSTMQHKLNWNDLREYTSQFYACTPCQQDYENQLRLVLNHVNKYTKHKYIDEPSIMAWELANEPRPMLTTAVDKYRQWTASVARLIKSIDRNHLVTLGTEGMMGTDESADLFKEVHQPEEVDYLTIHIWPKNWGWFKDTSIAGSLPELIAKTQQYIRQHEAIAYKLDKPLVVEEFGLPRDQHSFDPASSAHSRERLYDVVFAEWARSREQGGVIAGCNFWAFAGTARPVPGQIFWKEGDDLMGDPPQEEQGLNSVFDTDRLTWNIIRSYTLIQNKL